MHSASSLLFVSIAPHNTLLAQQSAVAPLASAPLCLVTAGYGDMVPVTLPGKVLASILMMSSLLVLALPITIVGTPPQPCPMLHAEVSTQSNWCIRGASMLLHDTS
jgi:hypothetical protein